MGLKYRPLRPRKGLRSSRAMLRGHRSWRTWALSVALLLFVGTCLALWVYTANSRMTGGQELAAINAQLRTQLAEVTAERDRLRAGADTAEAQLEMAHAAQDQLARQLKTAEAEAGQLKEDLGFFETLLPTSGDTSGIHVRSFRVAMDETRPHAMHYRLLVMQGGSKAFVEQPEFRGELQFIISAIRSGKPLTLTVPQPSDPPLPAVRLTHYQRIEGDLGIPQDAEVRAVSVRVLQNGQVRATQSVTP
ncbi:DUF6776 family protein [Cupriavidus sp. RAF12]|uniref:DUF6776 family protein n=1 Tax=Cupriavidus sp. RAF12 TaxID=3233050 RepID=UPI003F92C948